MTKNTHNSNEARLEVRLDPYIAEKLKESAKQAGISLNQMMKTICTWTACNLHVGKPKLLEHEIVVNESAEGMFWIGHEANHDEQDDGEVLAVFDFSTSRAIRNPRDFFYAEDNPLE